MFRFRNKTRTTEQRKRPNKVIVGFAALAATAVVSTTGLAAAQTMGKPSKADCVKAGYTNYGKCVSTWAHAHAHAQTPSAPGSGYGGNTSVATNLNLTISNSSHNVINVIVNIFR